MPKGKISKLWIFFVVLMVTLQLAYIDTFFIEPYWIQIEKVRIKNPALARALGGLKVIHLSDMHIEKLSFLEASLIRIIERLRPDLILISGDNVQTRQNVQTFVDAVSLFEPRFRTYIVVGESPGDSYLPKLRGAKMWDDAGASILYRQAIRVNLKNKDDTYLWLVNPSGPGGLHSLLKDIPEKEPVIVLYHFPEIVKQAALEGVDLVVAGNTHGGQCGVSFLRKIFPYSIRSVYIAGLFKVRNTLLYVNRGIFSEKGIRFMCRPEVTLYEFIAEGRAKQPKIVAQDRAY